MAIQFTCTNPSCGRSIHAPDDAAGKKARCPKCGQILMVPSADGVFTSVESESPPSPNPSRPAVPRRMMVTVPPTLHKPMNKRPFVVGGIVLVAVAVVVVVAMTAIKGNDKKAVTPAQSAQVAPTKVTANQNQSVVPNGPTSDNHSPPPTSGPAGSSHTPGQVVATPGAGITVVDMPAQYVNVLLDSRAIGQRAKSLEHMKLVRDAIIAYTMEADKFPGSWSELTRGGRLSPDAIKSIGDSNKNFVLISGQTQSSPKTNILAYDPFPYGRTSMVVIEVEGSPKFINIEDLKKQLMAQGAKANEMPD